METKIERNFKHLEEMWYHYFSCLPFEQYEYDINVKIINKIKNKCFEFTKEDKNNILKLINILILIGDYYDIIILEQIQKTICN